MSKEKKLEGEKPVIKTANFHARLTEEQEQKFLFCLKKAPKKLRIKSKTDLFLYMLETFADAIIQP